MSGEEAIRLGEGVAAGLSRGMGSGEPFQKALLVVDLDFTLVNSDTTLDFLKLAAPIRYKLLTRVLRPFSYASRFFVRDVYKIVLVLLCIQGRDKNFLDQLSTLYVSRIGSDKHPGYNEQILDCLKHSTQTAILLTGSLDFIAEKFRVLGFSRTVGSKSYYKNGRFHNFVDLHGKKHEFLQRFSPNYDCITVMEDSPEEEYGQITNLKVVTVRKWL